MLSGTARSRALSNQARDTFGNLDVTLLSACVEIDQRKLGALAAFTGFDGHDVLVVFGADFQFCNRAGVVVTLQLFALIGILIIIVR